MAAYLHEYAKPFFLEGGSHAVLMTHGFTGSPSHMRPIAEKLHSAGFTVQGLLLPGHGTKKEDMLKSTWEDWLAAELNAVHELKQKYDHVSVCGLSMGGVLTLIAAQQTDVTACVPIAAPVKIANPLIGLAKYARFVMPEINWKSRDEQSRSMLMPEYDHGYSGYPTKRANDLHILMKKAYKNLYAITCPTLIVQSYGDRTVKSVSAEMIYNGISAQTKEILWLRDVPHVCTITREYPHIAERMIRHLRAAEK
ncbi:MAG: alpha/beta fold hydrolase [Clostridia bacterium]|nr:alpha/beta fold hydrolase [Clostridia bacterium]